MDLLTFGDLAGRQVGVVERDNNGITFDPVDCRIVDGAFFHTSIDATDLRNSRLRWTATVSTYISCGLT